LVGLNKTKEKEKGKEKEEERLEETKAPEELDKEKESILARLPERSTVGGWRMRPLKFEKVI